MTPLSESFFAILESTETDRLPFILETLQSSSLRNMPANVHTPSVRTNPAYSTTAFTNMTPEWEVGKFKRSDRITEGMKKMRAYIKHNLGGQPYMDIKRKKMNHWLKMTVLKHSDELVHPESCTTAKWKALSADMGCRLYRSLTKYMPWLVCFEGN